MAENHNEALRPVQPVQGRPEEFEGRQAQGDSQKLRIAKIIIDRDLCIGAASCVAIAPGVFALDDENKAYVVDENGADQETILLAAQSCPTRAIILLDKDGNQIYP